MNRGLTLVEVLVVVVIIVVATALLLQGCADIRGGSARRAQCSNNEKNHTLALLNYEAAHKHFPGYKQELAGQDASWGVMLLPYLDRRDLWQQWKQGTPMKRFLRVYVCPSDPPKNMGREDGPSAYAVNTKVCKDGSGLSLDYVAKHDGTATTLLLSENLRTDKAHTWWDTDPLMVGFTDGPMAENVRSNHGSGVLAGFCDGHVAFLRDEIGDDLFKAIVTPDGGEPVDEGNL
ncbi:MAG: DUF1559 domain-containing protein [Thermoguttaceae bacterium]